MPCSRSASTPTCGLQQQEPDQRGDGHAGGDRRGEDRAEDADAAQVLVGQHRQADAERPAPIGTVISAKRNVSPSACWNSSLRNTSTYCCQPASRQLLAGGVAPLVAEPHRPAQRVEARTRRGRPSTAPASTSAVGTSRSRRFTAPGVDPPPVAASKRWRCALGHVDADRRCADRRDRRLGASWRTTTAGAADGRRCTSVSWPSCSTSRTVPRSSAPSARSTSHVLGADADEHARRRSSSPAGQHVHRRRADELGDEHRRRRGVHLAAACRPARCGPRSSPRRACPSSSPRPDRG